VEASLFKRANGFEREVDKATASGKKVTLKEYFPPDVAAQRLWLQNRMPEVYREKVEQKHTLSADDAFLRFLEHCESQGKAEQLQLVDRAAVEDAQVVEDGSGSSDSRPETAVGN
jgi:hypothetical protein